MIGTSVIGTGLTFRGASALRLRRTRASGIDVRLTAILVVNVGGYVGGRVELFAGVVTRVGTTASEQRASRNHEKER